MKNTNWNQIQSGQIVKFRYKGYEITEVQKRGHVLDPRFLYRKNQSLI